MSGKWAGDRQRPWSERRHAKAVLQRDQYACQYVLAPGIICNAPASQVDHVDRFGPRDDPANQQALCKYHHGKKTQAEAQAAKDRFRERRAAEKHPGLLE